METSLFAATFIVLAGVLLVLYRVISGATLHDRILAVNVIGTKTIVLIALVGYIYGRPGFFLDIALAYALINFIATIAVLRYMERRAKPSEQARKSGDTTDGDKPQAAGGGAQ